MNVCQNRIRSIVVMFLALCLLVPSFANAFDGFSDFFPTGGEGRAFFDLDTSKMSPESVPFLLNGILVTYGEVEAMGITPDFIVSFRGLNMGILTSGQAAEEVQGMVAALGEMGVVVTACAKAMYLSGADQADVVSGIEITENAWIDSMLLQNKRKGYAYITF